MMSWRTLVVTGIVLGFLSGSAEPKGGTISGQEAARQAGLLTTQIHWHQSLETALAQARRDNKPVFWMHMLGQLDGYT